MTVIRGAQGGHTLVGFIVGLVVGLGIAVAVALYVTKAPIPFINKLGHPPDAPLPDQGKLPDPNRSLYTKDAVAGGDGPGSTSTPVGPPAVAVVSATGTSSPNPAAPASGAKASSAPASVATAKTAPDAADAKQSFLQAGAYRSIDDAETMKGKLALLGFEAIVSNADRDGAPVYRVRLGPYSRVEDLNRVRQRLVENGVEAVIVPAAKASL